MPADPTSSTSDAPAWLQAMREVLPEDRISVRGEDLMVYARDMWPRGLMQLGAGCPPSRPPRAIVWPQGAQEVQRIVGLCRRHGVPLTPFGAGSGVCGGAAAAGGAVLDMKRMRRITAIDEERRTVTFEPGILGAHLEEALGRRGLTMGHFPSSIMCSTAGGWIATRGAGQCSTRYGKIEDMVVSLDVVTGTGDLLRTSVADDGPGWLQLFIGSEGTLGIITSATCVVRRAPAARRMRGWTFPDVEAACAAIREVMQMGLRPAVVRLYDPLDTLISGLSRSPRGGWSAGLPMWTDPSIEEVIEMLRPDVQRARKGIQRWLLSRLLAHPDLLNHLIERLVPRVGLGCLLILGFEGDEAVSLAEEEAAGQQLLASGGADLGPEPGERWLKHRYDVSFKMPKVFGAGAFVDTLEVATSWKRLHEMYLSVREAVSPYALIMAHFSHAYADGCSIYFTIAGRRTSARAHGIEQGAALEDDLRRYDAIWDAAMKAVIRCGGTISHHHGIGRLKGPYMDDEHGAGMTLLRGLKRVLDPDSILNPERLGLPC